MFHKNNSKNHWDLRFKTDWDYVGGPNQTIFFACGLFANIDKTIYKDVDSILDYGCGTGDSSIVFNIFLPKAKLFLHDLSHVAVDKAIKKYQRFLPVQRYDNFDKYDLVYSSNVIEHVEDPMIFINDIILKSKKFIIIQCPWKEYSRNGDKISPSNPVGEHFWTIDEDFIEKYFISLPNIQWNYNIGVVPMAWQGGEQVFIQGIIK